MTTRTTSARHSELMRRNVTVQRFGRTVAGFICDTVDSRADDETVNTYVGISPRAAQDCNISGEWINMDEVTFTDQPAPLTPYEYGRAAFERGIRCAPALDGDFLATRTGLPIGSRRDGAYDEWLRGWTDANLATPTFTATEQAQIDDMVARIDRGDMNRELFAQTTARLATQPSPTPERRHDLAARRVVEERTAAATEPTEYQVALTADNAWQAELVRLFGRNAGDVRYTEEGRTGPTLAPLYAEYRRACDAWHAKMTEQPAPTAECDLCETEQACEVTDDLTICADRPACEARCDAALDGYVGAQQADPEFQIGDIVAKSGEKQWYRIANASRVGSKPWCNFQPIRHNGERDRRWEVGFSGSTHGFYLVKREVQPDDEPAAEFYAQAQPPCPACGKADHSPETCPRAALIAVTAGFCACGKPAKVIVGGVLYCRECQTPVDFNARLDTLYQTHIGPRVEVYGATYAQERCECAICYSLQPCYDDGAAWICIDRAACSRRQAENRTPASEVPASLSPVEALRLALDRGVFGLETRAKLHAALEAADQEALTNAEQLAAARDAVKINLTMHQIEAAIFDLPC